MLSINTYLNCLNLTGTSTGIFDGIYDFSSGNNQIIYNQIYTTGQNFLNNLPLAANYPLISLNNSSIGTAFNNNLYSIGQSVSGNFGIILQLNYNGCIHNTTGIEYVILSTVPNYSGIQNGQGFCITVNDINRISILSSGNNQTLLGQELKQNNFFYIFLNNQQYLTYGIYDILNVNSNTNSLVLNNSLPINNNIYLGNFLNNNNSSYTGFSGYINFATLINQNLKIQDLTNCVECYFITGIQNLGTGTLTYQLPIITGYSGIQNLYTGITGYSYISGNIINSTGGSVPIYNISGLTGVLSGNVLSTLITGSINLNLTGNTNYNFIINTGLYNPFITYNLNFYLSLMSGDYIEIYTYNNFNGNVNNQFDNLFDYPNTNLNLQIFDNGLLQLSGFDFGVNEEQEITGLNTQDLIQYNLTTGFAITTAYSGWWARSKILLSGGSYFPSSSQYIESGSGIIITGINNNQIAFNTDLYLNGQKLISGLQYSFITSGNLNNIIILSGNYLPDFDYIPLYSPTGGLPTGILSTESNDLTFYPRENNPNYYLFNITGTTSTIANIYGFSTEIWINGIKQLKSFDYTRNFACSLNSGFEPNVYPFTFYSNESTFFNII